MDLCLGVMCNLSNRERERGNTSQTKQIERKERVCMHEICINMWLAKNKLHHGLKPNPNLPAHNFQ